MACKELTERHLEALVLIQCGQRLTGPDAASMLRDLDAAKMIARPNGGVPHILPDGQSMVDDWLELDAMDREVPL